MAIRLHCDNCDSTLNVSDSLAGKRGKCPKCGTVLAVPSMQNEVQANDASLTQSSPGQMVAELQRRGKSAALILFDTPKDGRYDLHEMPDTVVNCIGSDDMTAEQLNTLLRSTATLSEWHEQGALAPIDNQAKEPYDLKGDCLGMRLDDFKRKYYRVIKGHDKTAPYTSEYPPGHKMLLAEPWHAEAGIIHCTIEFPFERAQGMSGQTVAGVETDLLLYRFVDGALFQILTYFDTGQFELVRHALLDKYGKPVKEERKPISLFWWNGCSSISLSRGRINPKEWSTLNFTHDELFKIVLERSPQSSADL